MILWGCISAFWLGILTSISPCPLAGNIAAVSYLARSPSRPRRALLSALLYSLGRAFTYLTVAILIIWGLSAIPGVSNFLQKYLNLALGPFLILVGMVLVEMIPLNFSGWLEEKKVRRIADAKNIGGPILLGAILALSFCPVSAALFFGSLIPLSVKHHSLFLLPSLYGIGTGIPVAAFAVLIAAGAQSISKSFSQIARIEKGLRYAAGAIIILIGIYYSLKYIFMVW